MNNLYLIVRNQFPEFVREDYPVFIAFVQAYYKWLSQQSAGKLETIADLDETPQQFVQYFRSQLDTYGLFNESTKFNKLFIQKIKQIYSAKGSEQALVNILRLVYQADVTIKYPSTQILRASDGRWKRESFITIERTSGTLPATIDSFYIEYDYTSIRVAVNRSIVIDETTVRLYYTPRPAIALSNNQSITIKNASGNVIYSGRIIKSPTRLVVVDGGERWQLGQVIVVPGSVNNTVARVSEIDDNGAVTRVEILEHGYGHTQNQLITVSPYPNKPLGSRYSITSELVSVDPVSYHHTLDVFEYTEGTTEQTTGIMTGVFYGSYFLENYCDPSYNGTVVFEVSSVTVEPEPIIESDITMEEWLASRATFRYQFDTVTDLRGQWTDDSGKISNQNIRLEDDYYYQQFSYDIEATVNSEKYVNLARELHPAGTKLFTTYNILQEVEITTVAETTFPFLRLDLLDVSTITDNRAKRIVKNREDSVTSSEDFTFSMNKYLESSATVSSEDTAVVTTSTYDEETYFAEAYVITEKILTIGA